MLQRIMPMVLAGVMLTGCMGQGGFFKPEKPEPAGSVVVMLPEADGVRPKSRPTGQAVKPETMPAARPEQDLGETIVALGLLDRQGLWLRTPLVRSEVKGRVVYTKTDSSANLLLLPLDGDVGAGSQLSLAAMQVLGIPLGDVVKIRVFVR